MPPPNADVPPRQGPLTGLRIVEFAGIGPGPFAGMLLADLGAEVVRLDRPGGADPYSRHVMIRGRRPVVVDLKHPEDRERVLALLDEADALIEGFRPGVMERLGLAPEVVLGRNPRLVYGRMTGWGQDGPLSKAAGHDINYIALGGGLSAIGTGQAPVPPLNLVGDFGGGALYLVMGLLAGIIQARAGGKGQVVDCAICDGAVSLMAMFSDLAAQGKWNERRQANLLDGGAPFYRTYACADGRFIALGALEPQFHALLCRTCGFDDPLFERRDDPAVWPELTGRMAATFRARTQADWCALLEGSDACFAPVLSLSEAPGHPHLAARGSFVTIDGVVQPAAAPRFSVTPGAARPVATQPDDLAGLIAEWRSTRPAGQPT